MCLGVQGALRGARSAQLNVLQGRSQVEVWVPAGPCSSLLGLSSSCSQGPVLGISCGQKVTVFEVVKMWPVYPAALQPPSREPKCQLKRCEEPFSDSLLCCFLFM